MRFDPQRVDVRYLDIHDDELDDAQVTTWIRQPAALPGWLRDFPFLY